ncbi:MULTISPECIES: porin [Rhodobacterales]|uniref:porin n=1 Tax=Roseobacter sp. N2S TaxID=2663844 RepID=UPI002860819A|nr:MULTISPECIES: porin [Rhodobacterales]MDR6263161.1 outer membrane protein OmpU [Roseobacter sp. N2S]
MKKVLFATTALIATAGMAAADVNVSGSGRFGIVYNNQSNFGVKNTNAKTKIEKRMSINLDGSGSTDGGLDFGGRIRLRSDEGDAAGATSSANIWMGNDMFRITVGNTDGAMINRIGYFQGSVGLTGLHWANLSSNIGSVARFAINTFSSRANAGDVVRLDFNVGGFGVSLSTDTTGAFNAAGTGSEDAIAVSYNFGDWNVAAGYATNVLNVNSPAVEVDMFSISAAGNIGDFGVGIQFSDLELVGNKVTLNGSYNFGETTVTAFVAKTSEDTVGSAGIGAAGSESEYGIGFTHSLGGATLAGGISRNYAENTMADLGVRFNF